MGNTLNINETDVAKIKNHITALELEMAIFDMKYNKVMDKDAKMNIFAMSELIGKISSHFNENYDTSVKTNFQMT